MFSVQIVVAIVVLIIVDNDWDKDYDNDVSRLTTTATRLRASRYAVARDYGLRKEAAQSSTVVVAVVVHRNGLEESKKGSMKMTRFDIAPFALPDAPAGELKFEESRGMGKK